MKISKNVEIGHLSNFHTKNKSKYFAKIQGNISDKSFQNSLKKLFKRIKTEKLNTLFITGGTNSLFAFDKWNGMTIFTSKLTEDYYQKFSFTNYKNEYVSCNFFWDKEKKILEVGAGEKISDIAEILYRNFGEKKLLRFIGLPGSIAGAVAGNAGCFGLEIENVFEKALVFDSKEEDFKILNYQALNFSYRNSIIKQSNRFFILKVWLNLASKKEKYSFQRTLDDILEFRLNKQPNGFSCGSFFKNPSKENPAGKLIEEVGLKGFKLGGAFFSEKHANFLMSDGTAKWEDLINLKNLAQIKVKEKFNIDLEPEVKIIYN